MAKEFHFTAVGKLPEDAFDNADAVSALRAAVNAFISTVPEGIAVTHTYTIKTPKGPTGPRAKKVAAVPGQTDIEDAVKAA